jgi:hypothetical protein
VNHAQVLHVFLRGLLQFICSYRLGKTLTKQVAKFDFEENNAIAGIMPRSLKTEAPAIDATLPDDQALCARRWGQGERGLKCYGFVSHF